MTEVSGHELCLRDVCPWLPSDDPLAVEPVGNPLSGEILDAASARLINLNADKPFGSLLPALHALRSVRLPSEDLQTRTWNALRRLRITSWLDLLLTRPEDLLATPNFGMTSLRDLTALAVREAASSMSALLPTDTYAEPRPAQDALHMELTTWSDDRLLQGDAALLEALVQARVTLGDLFPGLADRAYEAVPAEILPTRLVNRIPLNSWWDFIEMTIAELASMPNVGARTVGELLVALRQEAASSAPRPILSGSQGGASPVPATIPERDGLVDDLLELLSWSQQEREASTVGDVLGLTDRLGPLSDRLRPVWDRLASEPILPMVSSPVASLIEVLLDGMPDRERTIMERRDWNLGTKVTLEELGEELELTRERVRQLESDARADLKRILARPSSATIQDRSEELRRRIGTAIPVGAAGVAEALAWATKGVREDRQEAAQGFLMWCAGPYVLRDGWLRLKQGGPDPRGAEIREAADSSGYVSDNSLNDALNAAGILAEAQEDWLDYVGNLIRVEGGWLDGTGTLVDLSFRYLSLRGVPMSVEEILEGIGRSASVRSVRQRLSEDDRFVRVSKNEVGLRGWDFDEYTSVADEMAEEIERCGGEIPLDVLVERLVERYGVSPTSVRMYAGRPMFFVDGQDHVSLRTDDNPYEVRDDLRLIPCCYELSATEAAWRVRVDRDVLRGSGRRIPEQLAGWLRLRPGDRFDARNDRRPVPLAWRPWAQPDIGSLKGFAEDLGAAEGDWLVLVFDRRGSVDVRLVEDPSKAEASLQVLARLVGVDDETLNLHAMLLRLAEVLDVTTSADDDSIRFRIRAALERRRDQDLVDLMDEVVFA